MLLAAFVLCGSLVQADVLCDVLKPSQPDTEPQNFDQTTVQFRAKNDTTKEIVIDAAGSGILKSDYDKKTDAEKAAFAAVAALSASTDAEGSTWLVVSDFNVKDKVLAYSTLAVGGDVYMLFPSYMFATGCYREN
jgi:hypothetical protein